MPHSHLEFDEPKPSGFYPHWGELKCWCVALPPFGQLLTVVKSFGVIYIQVALFHVAFSCILLHSQSTSWDFSKAGQNHLDLIHTAGISNLLIMHFPRTTFHKKGFFYSFSFPGTSWGFSIVGGAEPGSDRSPEPVHVLFVVPESPAAKVITLDDRCIQRIDLE